MTASLFKPESIHALTGVEPGLPVDDLAILGDITARARIVGLGEPTHGQNEINQLRDRMTRYLIEHRGFRVVAMEDSAIKCRVINEFIQHGRGTARSALTAQNFWTWKTREVLALIEWLREWNVDHPEDTVTFIGVDIQDLATPVSELFGVLTRIDLELATSFNSRLSPIGSVQMWGYSAYSDEIYSSHIKTIAEIQGLLETTRNISPEDLELGLDCVLALEQSLKLWREIARSPDGRSSERWNRRDDVMATRALEPTRGGAKVVLWAHNGHIQSERMDGLPEGAVTMGQVLREHLSFEYVVISGVFGSGGYRAYSDETTRLDTMDVGDPPEGTLDHELWSHADSPSLLMNLDAPGSVLFEPQTTRWAGALLVPNDEMMITVRPAIGSNAFAFVREATPSEPL